MSMPAETPADVTMSPSSTYRSSGRSSIVGSSSAKVVSAAQWVVAGRFASSPAAANTSDPVHTLASKGTASR